MREWRIEVQSHQSWSLYNQGMVDVLCDLGRVFNGFGRHTSNDVCHLAIIWPYTPAWVICEDDTLFEELLSVMVNYTQQWTSSDFERLVGGQCNSNNPFAFHYNSDEHYIARYLHVFRKMTVKLDPHLFNKMSRQGLFDPDHTIGESNSA